MLKFIWHRLIAHDVQKHRQDSALPSIVIDHTTMYKTAPQYTLIEVTSLPFELEVKSLRADWLCYGKHAIYPQDLVGQTGLKHRLYDWSI